MNPIIEAAAKEIDPGAWDFEHSESYYRRELARKLARAALRAMAECEPTVAVHEAIRNAMVDTQFSSRPLATGLAVWRALLLAAAEAVEG